MKEQQKTDSTVSPWRPFLCGGCHPPPFYGGDGTEMDSSCKVESICDVMVVLFGVSLLVVCHLWKSVNV